MTHLLLSLLILLKVRKCINLAVIIETYGSGNMPLDRPAIFKILQEANNRGIIIVNVSQCRKGVVSNSYECGSALEKYGVVFAGDMTVECCLAKLSYLLGKVNRNLIT